MTDSSSNKETANSVVETKINIYEILGVWPTNRQLGKVNCFLHNDK